MIALLRRSKKKYQVYAVMLRNSARLLRKYPLALMLLTALSVVSCGTSRTATASQTQIDRNSAVLTDSAAVTVTAENATTKSQLDSLLQATIQQIMNQEYEEAREQTLHFVIFDTTQPTDTVTGLPPVRATGTVTETSARKYKSQEKTQGSMQKEVHATRNDSTSVCQRSETEMKRQESDSLSVREQTQAEEQREHQPWKAWLAVGLVAVILLVCAVLYLRNMFKL